MTIKALAGTAATLYLAAMPIVAQAEDNKGKALKLEPITVSGEKTDSQASPKTTPFATQYNEITEEQIKEQGSKDFLNTMRNVPGVMFQSKNLMGSQTSHSLYVRGRGASHPSSDLTIEFDGAPRFGAIYGQTLSDGIAVPTIGGMDIYKSPQPWRFGSGYAMISVDPKYMKEEGQATELSASGGSHGTFLQSVAGGTETGRLRHLRVAGVGRRPTVTGIIPVPSSRTTMQMRERPSTNTGTCACWSITSTARPWLRGPTSRRPESPSPEPSGSIR